MSDLVFIFMSVKRFMVLVVLFGCVFSCKQTPNAENENQQAQYGSNATKVEVVDFEQLYPLLHKEDDRTYVINFWATWCKPCIKELPYFEELSARYDTDKITVILVSLDFMEQLSTGLIPFIEKHQLQSQVLLLDDPAANQWIPKVDTNWSGAIPATLIYNKNKRSFYEQSFTEASLDAALHKFL